MEYLVSDTTLKEQILNAVKEEKQRRIEKRKRKVVFSPIIGEKKLSKKQRKRQEYLRRVEIKQLSKSERRKNRKVKSSSSYINEKIKRQSYFPPNSNFYQEKHIGNEWFIKHWDGRLKEWTVAKYSEDSFQRYKNYSKNYVSPPVVSCSEVDLNKPTPLSDYQNYQEKMRAGKVDS